MIAYGGTSDKPRSNCSPETVTQRLSAWTRRGGSDELADLPYLRSRRATVLFAPPVSHAQRLFFFRVIRVFRG
jgi:hypothetical protein